MTKEKWVGGISDCCHAPLKEITGNILSVLICSECKEICNKRLDDDVEFPDDFDDE
jgi:hypothetical protein